MRDYLLVVTQPGGAVNFKTIKAWNNTEAIESATRVWRCFVHCVNCHWTVDELLDAETYERLPLDVVSLNDEARGGKRHFKIR